MGQVAEQMKTRLQAAFAPTRLEITDDSDKHQGHAGHREGGESHFTVVIESAVFSGLSRVERQRRINHALAEELAGPVHALSIRATAPGE
jgi:BolA protein